MYFLSCVEIKTTTKKTTVIEASIFTQSGHHPGAGNEIN